MLEVYIPYIYVVVFCREATYQAKSASIDINTMIFSMKRGSSPTCGN